MDLTDLSKLNACFNQGIRTIDSHTAGERTRLIVGGVGEVQGKTMIEKLNFFQKNFDDVRCRLTKEPRGHTGVLAAMVTKNVTKDAKFGLIYMDAKRYPYLCGHATIGAVASFARIGMLSFKEGENLVKIDTPSGVMEAVGNVTNGKLISVSIKMVPSFVLDVGKTVKVPEFGNIVVDIVYVGGFFAMVSSKEIKTEIKLKNKPFLTDLGMKLIDAANDQLEVFHPERPEVKTVDVVEFYDPDDDKNFKGKNMVIYGESNVDRSPCGTGTAAKLTLLHHKGLLDLNQIYTNFSPLGTSFEARIVKKEKIGRFNGISAEIKGMAQVTGIHNFVLEKSDPFPKGFMI
ncbi:MAG: proline racemase family protein [Desulfobacteraceae bacterium]|nr:proline racemase family protein [Desulfobacteraceae bacterium]